MTNINTTSNASNYPDFIHSGVDPRTGSFSTSVSLGRFFSHSGSGPTFDLHLNFTPGSNLDFGFGSGWTLPTGFYDSSVRAYPRLTLPDGQNYLVDPNSSSSGYYSLPYYKLNDIKIFRETNEQELIVVKKNGVRFVYDFKLGYLKRIISVKGLAISFTFSRTFSSEWALTNVTDNKNREITIDYQDLNLVKVKHLLSGNLHQEFHIRKQGGHGDLLLREVTQHNGGTDILSFSVNYTHFNSTDTHYIESVTYPSGMTEQIYYEDRHSTPTGYPVDSVPRVSRFERKNLGLEQPDSITDYSYTLNNYLGGNSGYRFQPGKDTLFFLPSDYSYGSTEIINNSKTIIRSYNKYHLLESVEYLDNDQKYYTEDYEYYADLGKVIEDQTAQYSMLKSLTKTHYHNRESSEYTMEYEYDDYANTLIEKRADGSIVLREYYPSDGEEGACPPDPNGMISKVKSETFIPATLGQESRTTTMTYKSLAWLDDYTQFDDNSQYFLVLGTQTDSNEQFQIEYNDDRSDSLSYGRVANEIVSRGGTPTTTLYQYDFLADGLKTTTTLLGHDNLTMSTSELVDYFFFYPVESIDSDGNVSRFVYDQLGRLTSEVTAADTDYEALTSYTYQVGQDNNKTTVTDSSGNKTITVLNNAGKTIRIQLQGRDDLQPKTIQQFDYDEFGLMTSQTDTDWIDQNPLTIITTRYEYDYNGEVNKVIHMDGRIEDICQNPVCLTTTNQHSAVVPGDTGRPVILLTEETTFNLSGLVQSKKVTTDSGKQEIAILNYEYDGFGNLLKITDIEGRVTELHYDRFDRRTDIVSHIDGQQVIKSVSYPSFTSEAIPETVSVNQVELGSRQYDGLLRQKKEIVNNQVTSYNYEGSSALPDSITTAKGHVLSFTNNHYLQAPESVSCSTDRGLDCIYQYDKISGLPISDSNESCQRNFTYDSFGRVVTESVKYAGSPPKNATFRYSFLGKLLEKTDFFGHSTKYHYDSMGRLQEIDETVSGTHTTTTIDYDVFSRAYKYTTNRGSDTAEIELSFNALGLETQRVAHFNGTEEFSIVQEFNIRQLLVQRIFIDAQGKTVETFTYDDLARLNCYDCQGIHAPLDKYGNKITRQSFVYDLHDNVLNVTSNFDGGSSNITTFQYFPSYTPIWLIRLTNTHSDYPAEVIFRYDAAGNLLNDEQGREYAYNILNQLSSVASSDGHQISQYAYDARGRVVSQTVEDNLLSLFYLGDKLSNELCGEQHTSLHSLAPGLLVRTVDCAGDQLHQFMLGNSQGSVIETLSTNTTNTRDKETRRYTPYGEDKSISDTAHYNNGQSILHPSPFGFNGERQDPVTKLYPLGNGYRSYSPVLTRFASYDSASPFGDYGINGYSYCLGDPLNYRDPSGHFLSILVGAVVGAVVGAAVSATTEVVKTVINPDHEFDWKQVAIGASLGAMSGGLGVATKAMSTTVKVFTTIGEEAVAFFTEIKVNETPVKQAAFGSLVGGTTGLLGSIKPKGVDSSGRSRSSNASVKNKEKVPERRTASEKVTSNREKIKRDVPSESVYTTGGDTDNFRGFPNEASLGTDTFLLSRSMTEDDITELHKLTGAGVTAAKKSALSTHGIQVVDVGILFSELFRVYKQR